ncbi:MAG: Ig domain-containing protein [Chloroflexota bacterium]
MTHRTLSSSNCRHLSPLIRTILIASLITAFLGLSFTKVARASGSNLLQNPTFDTDVTGWTPFTFITADWAIFDADGSGNSGSLVVTNSGAGLLNSGAVQCITGITPGVAYTYGGKFRVSSGQTASGFNGIVISWFTGANCTGNQTSGPGVTGATSFNAWTVGSVSSTVAPAGTASAWLYLNVGKDVIGGTYAAYFDDLYFSTVASTAPIITSAAPLPGTVNAFYTHNYAATGSTPITYALTSGTLPPGLTLYGNVGTISGTPTSVGTFTGTVTASNGTLPNATQNFSIKITSSYVQTVGIFRPSSATFYLRNANTTGSADLSTPLGTSSDLPIVGDWNGDGISTVGVFRYSTAQFFLRDSNSAGAPIVYSFTLGAPGDLPMAGDWGKTGKDGVGVFRPSNGLIYLKKTLTTGFADYQMVLGIPGDKPVAGDWNNDDTDSPGVYRPSNSTFYLTNQVCNCNAAANYQATLGVLGDSPFAGDWDGNGSSGIGVFRPTNGLIYLKNSPTTGFADLSIVFGIANDKPVAGHWIAGPLIAAKPSTPATQQIAPTFVP